MNQPVVFVDAQSERGEGLDAAEPTHAGPREQNPLAAGFVQGDGGQTE
jgi:hypothetical protein